MRLKNLTVVASALFLALGVSADTAKPKYGNQAERLYNWHEYFKRASAPDFWALMPYYTPQLTEGSCSVAALQMVVNALRAPRALGAADELAHHDAILKKVDVFKIGKEEGIRGVSLDGMVKVLEAAFKAYGLEGYRFEKVRAEAATPDAKKKLAAKLHDALVANEKSDRDMIIPLYLQSELTGDPEGAVGHFAPVAAYDAKSKRVLLFDPDRKWYEPYWVSEETFLAGMMAKADSVKPGGWIWVRL